MSNDIISLYRARLAKEKGAIKKDWGGKLSIALIYPNHYRLGMANLGFQVVYHLLNQRPDVVAERVFLPEGQEMSLYLQSGKPLLSLESQNSLQNFHLIAFSVSFENDYPNILKILEMAKLPLLAEQRTAHHPYVMAGGVTTFLNPEPLAPFMDLFLLGEAEANLTHLVDQCLGAIPVQKKDRKEILFHLAQGVEGLYVPALYKPEYGEKGPLEAFEPLEKEIPRKIKAPYALSGERQELAPASIITTPDGEFGDRILVELGRGCGRSCRFCAAGYAYRPPRVHERASVAQAVQKALKRCDQVGLLSAAVSDFAGIEDLAATIADGGHGFSVSSLRADSLSRGLLESLKKTGQKTVAIAPEAGSDRLRAVINKHLSREQILEAAKLISETGNFSIRLYFLIGLPTETKGDVAEIVDLVKGIRHQMIKASAPLGQMGKIKLSVNCFVPKPFTPFQWSPMEMIASLKVKQKRLKKALEREGGIRVTTDLPKWAYLQSLLSIGDRRVGKILLNAHRSGGNWSRILRQSELNPDFFVYRPKAEQELFPWDFIDHGISKRYLYKEYELALQGKESQECHVGECVRCGVCLSQGPSEI